MIGPETTSHQPLWNPRPHLIWTVAAVYISCGRPSDPMREQQHLRKRNQQRRKTLWNTTYWKHTGFIFSLWLSPDFYYVWATLMCRSDGTATERRRGCVSITSNSTTSKGRRLPRTVASLSAHAVTGPITSRVRMKLNLFQGLKHEKLVKWSRISFAWKFERQPPTAVNNGINKELPSHSGFHPGLQSCSLRKLIIRKRKQPIYKSSYWILQKKS